LLGEYEEYITKLFGFDKVLPMNTGKFTVHYKLYTKSSLGGMGGLYILKYVHKSTTIYLQ